MAAAATKLPRSNGRMGASARSPTRLCVAALHSLHIDTLSILKLASMNMGPSSHDWEPVILRKGKPKSSDLKDDAAINAVRAPGK